MTINQDSTPTEVRNWLEAKKFSKRCVSEERKVCMHEDGHLGHRCQSFYSQIA